MRGLRRSILQTLLAGNRSNRHSFTVLHTLVCTLMICELIETLKNFWKPHFSSGIRQFHGMGKIFIHFPKTPVNINYEKYWRLP